MTGKNIGDLLNAAGISWGGFMGGFDLTAHQRQRHDRLRAQHLIRASWAARVTDYIPHHDWFQYYKSTANPTHARPSSIAGDRPYASSRTARPSIRPTTSTTSTTSTRAVKAGNFPAVSYIKLPAYQDGHAGYSDPLDEQDGTVDLINFLQQQPDWKDTAVIITYDDSDGWYDHAYAKPTSASFDATGRPGQRPRPVRHRRRTPPQPNGVDGKPVNGRCGPGTRIPFLVISPYAKQNYVSHTRISQASVVRFIEDNWLHGAASGWRLVRRQRRIDHGHVRFRSRSRP